MHLNVVCVCFVVSTRIIRQSPCQVTHKHNAVLSDTLKEYFSRINFLRNDIFYKLRVFKWSIVSRATECRRKPTRNQIRQGANESHNIRYIGLVVCFNVEYVKCSVRRLAGNIQRIQARSVETNEIPSLKTKELKMRMISWTIVSPLYRV